MANSRVKSYKRKGRNSSTSVRAHIRKHGDKWPPIKKGAGLEFLSKYRNRIIKEIKGLNSGKLTSPASHKRFMGKRLNQVNKAIVKASNEKKDK